MSSAPVLVANVGAEEGPGWRELASEPRVATVAALFAGLFDEPRPFDWLEAEEGEAVAWWADTTAHAEAASQGRQLRGASAEVVERVHDKAFAHEVAQREGLVPEPLQGLVSVLAPEALRADGAASRILEQVAGWPAWTRGRFTLKPRLGTSARGRIAGVSGETAASELGGGLERLAARGGAMLEPWLGRRGDYSVQLHLGGEAGVTMLGALTQRSAVSGIVAGHSGHVDARGRVRSASEFEEPMREAALAVALAAREAGYEGPCGVDGFAFESPDGSVWLRPVVELNARFTLGTVALAAVRRMLPRAKQELGLSPGVLVSFAFVLDAPDPPPGVLSTALPGHTLRPALWMAATPDLLEPGFGS